MAENESLGFIFVGDIFGNRVNPECASYCHFSLVNTRHPEVSMRNQEALSFCSRNQKIKKLRNVFKFHINSLLRLEKHLTNDSVWAKGFWHNHIHYLKKKVSTNRFLLIFIFLLYVFFSNWIVSHLNKVISFTTSLKSGCPSLIKYLKWHRIHYHLTE